MAPTTKTAETVDETPAETPETTEVTPDVLPVSYASYEPSDFEVRQAALRLAIDAHESYPVLAAPEYYAFLTGAAPATAE